MEHFSIEGGFPLRGEFFIRGAKNSVLPIIAASILTKEPVLIKNAPRISDIFSMLNLLKGMGIFAEFIDNDICIDAKYATPKLLQSSLTSALRSSIFLLGPMLSRFKKLKIGKPGGCAIGKRPINLHINCLESLGCKVNEEENYIECDGENLKAGVAFLSFPSVGATENFIMAAVLTEGTSVLQGAAKEPEIVDLANFLNHIGARVFGAGTSTIIIEGVKKLGGGVFYPSLDRIAFGTYFAAAAASKGSTILRATKKNEKINKCELERLKKNSLAVLSAFKTIGCSIRCGNDFISLTSGSSIYPTNISAAPHPNFPTDMQSQFSAVLLFAEGTSTIEEAVFENRFGAAKQFRNLGAEISIEKNLLTINGGKTLTGADLLAEDLRGGAALCIAALGVEGKSRVFAPHHIDRGYEDFEGTLKGMGARIKRQISE